MLSLNSHLLPAQTVVPFHGTFFPQGHPPSTSQLDNLTPCFEYLSEGIRSHKVLPCVGANAVRKSYFSARELNNTFIPHGSQLCDLLNSHSLVIRFGDAWLAGGVGGPRTG
uniref:Uncharacterized protein n=1 Tax=Mesocestoides corti TaxID=53468 RepID=A0A5K3F9V0_MESCO